MKAESVKVSADKAPIVDESLASLFKDMSNPREKVCADQGMAIFLDALSGNFKRRKSGHLVQLECGHFVVTRAVNKTGCYRCGAMIRAGYDYDKFRNLNGSDDFEWPSDPLKSINGPKD